MAAGALDAGADARELPLADGGEGTLDVLLAASGGERRRSLVSGPLGDPVEAEWALLPGGTAVVEMARASGLALVGRERNDPLRATTRGTGELIRAAAGAGARRVLVGVGGSATVDGGLGAVEALGWSLAGLPVTVACDVETRFVEAAAVFGPQKGAGEQEVRLLTERLETLAGRYRERTGADVARLAGAGAAGGLAGGLAALGATLLPGFDAVADAVGLDAALAEADLVLTGEGRLDASSLAGKVVGGVLARAGGRRCGVIVGQAEPGVDALLPARTLLRVLTADASEEEATANAAALVRAAARELVGQT